MNAYQVGYEARDGSIGTVSVAASSSDVARYAAFDELTDRSIAVARFLFTRIWREETSRWVPTIERAHV